MMKSFVNLLTLILFAVALQAQTGNTKSNTSKNLVCRTLKDSASYSLGYNIGQNLAGRYDNMDINILIQAIKDAYLNKQSVVDVNSGPATVSAFVLNEQKKKAEANKAEGKKYLQEIMRKTGVITTASGLRYEVITMGSGEKPTATDKVKVNYSGKLINGKEFDNSARHGGPTQFNVSGVIPGWTEALQLMPVGSKFKLYVPANLAYDESPMGSDIPPGSTLIFDLELLEIVK